MVGALLVVALLFYAVLYSGISELRGTPVGVWDALTGGTPAPGATAAALRGKIVTSTKLAPNPVGSAVVAAGRSFLGTPYRFGGVGPPGGVDCSGFTMRAYAKATGYQLPHNAAAQFAGAVKLANPSPGDLCFYSIFSSLDHVGIVTEASGGSAVRVIDAVGSHGGVSEHGLGVNEQHIVAYGRPRFLVIGARTHPGSQGPHPQQGAGG